MKKQTKQAILAEILNQNKLIQDLEVSIEIGSGIVWAIKKIVTRIKIRRAKRKKEQLQTQADAMPSEEAFV